MAQIAIGGKFYDDGQMFEVDLDSVVGPVKINAAQMANLYSKNGVMGNSVQAGQLQGFKTSGEPPKQEAPAAPAAAPSAPRRSVLAPSAPPPAPLNQEVTQKDRDEVTKPAKGLENTIKTSPTLLREKRRKSYLTAGG